MITGQSPGRIWTATVGRTHMSEMTPIPTRKLPVRRARGERRLWQALRCPEIAAAWEMQQDEMTLLAPVGHGHRDGDENAIRLSRLLSSHGSPGHS